MKETYRELGRQAEDAVRDIKDKDLRREAFRILLLQFITGKHGRNGHRSYSSDNAAGTGAGKAANGGSKKQGRSRGGVATVAVQKLIDSGALNTGHDASGILRELARKRIILTPSQLRMVLLRFSRNGRLKRKIKMKGEKITYLYSSK